MEMEENSDNQNHQKDEFSCLVRKMTAKEPEALRKLCEETQNDLTKEEIRQMSGLQKKHSSVFQLDGEALGRIDLIRHDIKTSIHPIRQPPQRFPIGLREEEEKQIDKMLG